VKKQILLFTISLFAIGLLLGYKVTGAFLFSGGSSEKLAARPVERQFHTLKNGQRNILAVVVDDLTSPAPELVSVWMGIYRPQDPFLTLMPIYPSLPPGKPQADQAFEEVFEIERKNGHFEIAPAFFELPELANLWRSGYVILDNHALDQLVAWSLAAVEQQEEEMADADIYSQGAINSFSLYQNTCQQIASRLVYDPSDLTKNILDLMPDHLVVDFSKEQFLLELHTIREFGSSIVCSSPAIEAFILAQRW
jgi:hypothetical protein